MYVASVTVLKISVCQLNHSREGVLPAYQVCMNKSTRTSGHKHTLYECLYICPRTENLLR